MSYDSDAILVEELLDLRARLAELKRTPIEQSLQQSQELNRRILEAVPAGVIHIANDGALVRANREAQQFLGLSYEEITDRYVADVRIEMIRENGSLVSVEDYPVSRCLVTQQAQPPTTLGIRRPDGQVRWATFTAVPVTDPATREFLGVVVTLLDITDHKRAEEALRQANNDLEARVEARTAELTEANEVLTREIAERRRVEAELRAEQRLLEYLLADHERDRQLIAYEIHDGFVQDAVGAKMYLEASRRNDAPEDGKSDELEMAARLLGQAIDEGRQLITGLRPPILDEQGIIQALNYLMNERRVPGVLDIEFEHDTQFDRLAPLAEGAIYRIVQESLTNIERHSQSDKALIRLTQVDGRLRLEVRDWGIGFDPRQVVEDRFGLQGIRERARLLRGKATISSSPGQGCSITVDLPVSIPKKPSVTA
jgi:PAS domain S-box-containing protein